MWYWDCCAVPGRTTRHVWDIRSRNGTFTQCDRHDVFWYGFGPSSPLYFKPGATHTWPQSTHNVTFTAFATCCRRNLRSWRRPEQGRNRIPQQELHAQAQQSSFHSDVGEVAQAGARALVRLWRQNGKRRESRHRAQKPLDTFGGNVRDEDRSLACVRERRIAFRDGWQSGKEPAAGLYGHRTGTQIRRRIRGVLGWPVHVRQGDFTRGGEDSARQVRIQPHGAPFWLPESQHVSAKPPAPRPIRTRE